MKELIVMSACPGSGKSAWVKRFCKTHKHVRVISSDEVRYELTNTYQDFSRQDEVWRTIDERVVKYGEEKIKGKMYVILDACIDLNSLRIKYAQLGKNYDKRLLVAIKKPFEEVKKNNLDRNPLKFVPENILEMMYKKFEHPSDEAISAYDEYIYIEKRFK